MDRRDFMKLCSVAGLGVVGTSLPVGFRRAHAAGLQGFFMASASGGWDIANVNCPKGDAVNSEGYAINENFTTAEILQSGNIEYAPVGNNQAFFDKYYQMTTVIRGIDTETNGHDTGQRGTFSGRLIENTPCFAALLAAAIGAEKPLAFITNGGYSFTGGVCAQTRLGNTDSLEALIYPNRVNPNDEESAVYLTDNTMTRIRDTLTARTKRYVEKMNLPRQRNAMGLLYLSRLGMADLAKIDEYEPDGGWGNGLERQANIILAAYKAGLAACGTMSRGGFDTHGPNTDDNQATRSGELLAGVDYFWQRAEQLNVADEILMLVGSDFGRTPKYNMQGGKDHWSVGQVIVQSSQLKNPNRMIGDTDDTLRYEKIDPVTLAVSEGADAVKITNGAIHKWLRKFYGIENDQNVKLFPIDTEVELDFG